MRHKIPGHFEIQTDHRIPARRPDLVIVNKKKKTTKKPKKKKKKTKTKREPAELWILLSQRIAEGKTKENEKKDKYFDLARERKKLWNM